tara:strand:- start:144817 stop:146055 length:1239 start_codon:yes stop_codon:yes gene_type:complete
VKKQVLVIALNWPAPNFTAAGVRLFQLIDFFKQRNCQITLASTAEEHSNDISNNGGINRVKIQLNHDSFDTFVQELDPQIVLFDRFTAEEQFGWRVAEQAPQAIRILDTEDLHSLRASRAEAIKDNNNFTITQWLQSDKTKREVASIYRSDLSLIISDYEMQILRPIVHGHKRLLLQLPFMLNPIDQNKIDSWRTFEERYDFLFIGFGGHAPNVDAIVQLKTKIWPLIRNKLPQSELNIYGANLPQHVYQMHQAKDGFIVKGWAREVSEVMGKARVLLAPLRYGAGIKGKLVDAMQYGTPSVTTKIGAESMHENLAWNGCVEDDPEEFAQAAVELYQNRKKWLEAQKNGIVIVNTVYDKKVSSQRLESILKHLEGDLTAHRTKNFIGSLLRHQTMQGTKYLSKWIQEKNVKH